MAIAIARHSQILDFAKVHVEMKASFSMAEEPLFSAWKLTKIRDDMEGKSPIECNKQHISSSIMTNMAT
jgi:hypothetical protein